MMPKNSALDNICPFNYGVIVGIFLLNFGGVSLYLFLSDVFKANNMSSFWEIPGCGECSSVRGSKETPHTADICPIPFNVWNTYLHLVDIHE